MCALNKYSFIDHISIDHSCLNNNKIPLNGKGCAFLAVSFINFKRGKAENNYHRSISQKFGWKKHYVNWELYWRRREAGLLSF